MLTDGMWDQLEPLLPDRSPKRGGRWRDHREVVEAIIWRFPAGSPWRDLPEDFPAWQTVWWRFDRWSKPGQAGDNPELMPVLADIAVPTGGRPRSRPSTVTADKAYSHPDHPNRPAPQRHPGGHPAAA